jgi:glycosyltransferase involved in cell wall biosynthesis
MNIFMVTNTFIPHVGGVARSVQRFTETYRNLGHDVTVVAPGVPGQEVEETGVFRIPAYGNINGSSFNLPALTGRTERDLSLAGVLHGPDVIHSHHPFLLGELARRLSDRWRVPLVFTHHTMYEQYTYSMGEAGKGSFAPTFVAQLATEYANNCDCVIAPSESTRDILRSRGVVAPIEVVPTGVDVDRFARGDKQAWRRRLGIPASAPIIGHVGRLAKEKNLGFLAQAVRRVLEKAPQAHAIVVGDGPAAEEVRRDFLRGPADRVARRIHFLGVQQGQDLVDAYHALDVFGFSSKSETQGMVLVEAMAAGAPVVALDAPGARDVVVDGRNGRLVRQETPDALANALVDAFRRLDVLKQGASATAQNFSQAACAKRATSIYRSATFAPKKLHHALSLVRRLL